ncbi:hypothetical protein ACROYT_G036235 [Oculina patagonica]
MSVPLRANISRGNPEKVFDLIEKVGGGTYGDVFKARVISTGELAAVKVVKVEPGDDFELIQQEIAMMQNCQHPNIIQYIGSYIRRDKLWIAMEFCGAGSAQDIYCMTGPCSEPQISFICVETLKGLAYLHDKNLMHRDIKGANILLTTQGNIKLADFGIAARISETMTKRKSFIGTPYWMAPEMAAVERLGGYDLKCDIWAVGITAIELAELQPPMFDLHPMRALYNIGKRSFVPPTLKEKDKWSPELHSFLKTALQKNPKKRPTADKMLTHPFCCHGYTRAVIQDLLDLFKRKSDKKGHIGEPENDTDDDGVDENVQVLTRIRSRKAPDKNQERSSMSGSEGKLDKIQVEPMVSRETRPQHQTENGPQRVHNGDVTMNNNEDSGTMKVLEQPDDNDEPPPLPPKLNRNSHYQVPQPSMKPVPPPKPGHLKLSRATSAQDPSQLTPQPKPRKFSEVDPQNRIPPPSIPPPKPPVAARSSDPGKLSAGRKTSVTTCFSKIFNECPLHIYCTGLWMNPNTGEKHIIIGAEEGVYSLNFSEQLHEAEMEQVCAKRCTWLSVFQNVMVSLQGSPSCVYMHNLETLHDRQQAFFATVTRNNRISETRGCSKCCIVNNPYNSQVYLCVALQKSVFLYQWYEPWGRFMKVQYYDVDIPSPPPLFEPLIKQDLEYPLICVGVRETSDGNLYFECVNLNSLSNWFTELPEGKKLDIDTVDHLEKDTVLVAFNNMVRFVNLEGKTKQFRRQMSEIQFDIKPESVVCLQGSVLAFHEHGLQGRSLHSGKVNVEMNDPRRTFRLLGCESIAVVESRPSDQPNAPCNLYILASNKPTHK